jgi:hypothetical protein
MSIIELTDKARLAEIDAHMAAHVTFLKNATAKTTTAMGVPRRASSSR